MSTINAILPVWGAFCRRFSPFILHQLQLFGSCSPSRTWLLAVTPPFQPHHAILLEVVLIHRGVKVFIATAKTTVPKTVHLVEPDWDSLCYGLLGNSDSSNKASDSRLLYTGKKFHINGFFVTLNTFIIYILRFLMLFYFWLLKGRDISDIPTLFALV